MVMPCSRSARRPSVSSARSGASWPRLARDPLDGLQLVGEHRLGVVQQPADQGGLAVVDGTGGGEPQQGGGRELLGELARWCWSCLEVPLALAVFHRGLGHLVVGAGGAALGEPGGGDLGDHRVQRGRRRSRRRRCRTCRRPCGSAPAASRPSRRPSGRPTRRRSATCRCAGRPRARARSRSRGSSMPSRAMYCHTSSSVQLDSGKTRTCSPGACRPLYSCHSSGRWRRGSHWENSSRSEKTRSLARAFSSSRRPPPKTASNLLASGSSRSAARSAAGCGCRPGARAAAARRCSPARRRRAAAARARRPCGRGSPAPRGSCARCRRAAARTAPAPARTPSAPGAA